MSNIKENKIQFFSEAEIVKSTRTLSILSALLFVCFALLDLWAIPSALSDVFLVRGIVVFCLGLTFLSTMHPSFCRYKDHILTFIFLVTAIGIEYMVFVATPNDHAYSVYFVGLVLILMTLYSWTYINFNLALVITVLIVSSYVYIESFTRSQEAMLNIAELLANLFFIGAAVVIGIVARLMRDAFIRENYLLQQNLKEAYEKKAEEARDHKYLANHDSLTELPNRRHMIELLNQSLEVAKEKDKVLVIMFMDLNGFKQINDTYGHNAGDEILTIVAKRLELAVRKGDHICRLGGDEYLMGLLVGKEKLYDVESMADKFVEVVSHPMKVEGTRLKVGASIGVAAYPMHGNNIEALINIADHRMYDAKKNKNNHVSFDDNSNKEINESVVIFPGNR